MKKNNSNFRALSIILFLIFSYVNAKSSVLNPVIILSKTDTINPKLTLKNTTASLKNSETVDNDETVILDYIDDVLIKLTINGIDFTSEDLTSFKENQQLLNEEMEAVKQERENVRREAAEVKKEAINVRKQIEELLKLREQLKVKSE